jgi:hypothetical protein
LDKETPLWPLVVCFLILALIFAAAVLTAKPAAAHCFSTWKYPWPQHCGGLYARRTPVAAVTPPIRAAALTPEDPPPAPDPAPPPAREVWPGLQQWDDELAAERALALTRLREELATPR